ncbi:MAG TPA: hypothetical protein VKU61_05685 [Candidatus Binatia bacterium]|nr:hypothetical protein [Candidatus Binatia bacterium]
MGKDHAKPILHFYCRPCAEYHLKTHPHFAEAQARARKQKRKAVKPKGRE